MDERLREELQRLTTCEICLREEQRLYSLRCGHELCRDCIARVASVFGNVVDEWRSAFPRNTVVVDWRPDPSCGWIPRCPFCRTPIRPGSVLDCSLALFLRSPLVEFLGLPPDWSMPEGSARVVLDQFFKVTDTEGEVVKVTIRMSPEGNQGGWDQ